ncbi:MAG: amidohydrolase [Hyphomicrobiaceae bacterium]|nr:amidohydrolase [Hyphomicrobiaceae bacterium]
MSGDWTGAIDCDFHPRAPSPRVLSRYMDEHWRSAVETRGIDVWQSISYPANSPLTMRPDWREASANADPVKAAQATLDRFGFAHAICNCLFPVQAFRDENLAAAFARAVNDWLAAQWLAKDSRLRASVVLPMQSPARAVEEIERRADDPRFVQVLVLVFGEQPLGKSAYWPVYAAAERYGFSLGIHAGSSYHHAVTGSGWPSYYLEDYAAQASGFHTQLGSLVCEGVFAKFPKLKVVLIESGVTWLPPYLWRLTKFWRGVRSEVPWVDRPPEEIVRDHVRLTTQPYDAPPAGSAGAANIGRLMDQLQSDEMLLFATDFPHWQFDGEEMLPAGLAADLRRKVLIDNPLATYPRLRRPT